MTHWLRSLALAALALSACTDESGPIDIWVVTFDTDSHDFELRPERVETIDSVAKARGGTTRIIKEPVVRAGDTEYEIEFDGGEPPNILFSEADGAVIPEDWDSLTLLSYYHHLEKSVAWFDQVIGYTDVQQIVPLPSYYRLEVGFDQSLIGLTDNAAYAPTAHSFLLFESFFFSDLPLAMNDGVVTHELGHAVFHRIMNGDERLPIEYRQGWSDSAIAHLAAVHEGQSDIWAGMQLDDPDFFRFSLPSDLVDRDMSKERILTVDQRYELSRGISEPHEIGAIIASAAWEFSETHGRLRTAELTFAAEEALTPELDTDFRISDFLEKFADACTPAEKIDACNIFCYRFSPLKTEITTCACP